MNKQYICPIYEVSLYVYADVITPKEFKSLGFNEVSEYRKFLKQNNIMAIKTSQFRCPKKGERYLSGAIPTAYLAPNDLSNEFWICKLVIVETDTIKTIVRFPK